jgi:hypothetical protein
MLNHASLLTIALITFSFATPFGFGRTEFARESINPVGKSTACQFPTPTASCGVSLFINDVKYLGKSAANDLFRVEFIFTPQGQNLCLGSVPSMQGVGLSQSLFSASFNVSLNVTRRGGKLDTGSKAFTDSTTGSISVEVKVPRGVLEMDPVEVEAKLDVNVTFNSRAIARVSGTGVPSPAPSQQIFPGTTTMAQCFPSVTITGIGYVQGSQRQRDTVTVNWTTTQPPSTCLRISKVIANAKLTRADGSIGTGQGEGNGTATLQISGDPGNVVSFEVNVTALAASIPESVRDNTKRTFFY